MKRQILNYETPEVEIVEINVEKGYNDSSTGVDGGGGSGETDDGDLS